MAIIDAGAFHVRAASLIHGFPTNRTPLAALPLSTRAHDATRLRAVSFAASFTPPFASPEPARSLVARHGDRGDGTCCNSARLRHSTRNCVFPFSSSASLFPSSTFTSLVSLSTHNGTHQQDHAPRRPQRASSVRQPVLPFAMLLR